jgi:hypothetical protein
MDSILIRDEKKKTKKLIKLKNKKQKYLTKNNLLEKINSI